MKVTKRGLILLSTVLLTSVITGCSTNNKVLQTKCGENLHEERKCAPDISDNEPISEPVGIVAGSLKTDIAKVQGTELKYVFTIQNDKTEDQTLVFPSSQKYDYTIVNGKSEVIYTFGRDKVFTQSITEKVLKPGEILEFEVDFKEGLQNLEPGTYKIDIWATLQNSNGIRTEISLDINEPTPKKGASTTNEEFTTVPVTYVGRIDMNSIEIVNEEGFTEVYRLSESAKKQVTKLIEEQIIRITYKMDENSQRKVLSFNVPE